MLPVDVDDSDWPLVVYTFTGDQTDAGADHMIRRQQEIFARNQRYVALARLRNAQPHIGVVRRLGHWTLENRVLIRTWCVGSAFVMSSPAVRFSLTAYMMIARPAFPMTLCETEPEARAWLAARLRDRGLPIPTRLAVTVTASRE